MSVDKKLGQRVAAQRKLAGLTQAQLAEKVVVATETISRLERGASVPSLASIEKIARVLNVELPSLFQFREKETDKDRSVDRLLSIVRPRPADDVNVVADVASRMFERWSPELPRLPGSPGRNPVGNPGPRLPTDKKGVSRARRGVSNA